MSEHQNKGESNGRARLNWDSVRKIRSLNELDPKQYKQEVLAKMYNVSQPAVCQILGKKRWWPDPEFKEETTSYREAKNSVELLRNILDSINEDDDE